MVRGGRKEEGSGWETRVYLWRIHVDIWQNQYNIVKLKNKIRADTKSRMNIYLFMKRTRKAILPSKDGAKL